MKCPQCGKPMTLETCNPDMWACSCGCSAYVVNSVLQFTDTDGNRATPMTSFDDSDRIIESIEREIEALRNQPIM